MLNFYRRYCVHFLIAAIGLAVFAVLFSLFAAMVSEDCSVMYRVSSINNNEILFSSVKENEGEGFYNLNGGCYVFTCGGSRIVADVFMEMADTQYGDNTMLYMGGTGENSCAVSANIMRSLGLKTGDTITCGGVTFTVTQRLTAQEGTDESFGYKGIIILSYNTDVLKSVSTYSYVTFMKDGDAYSGLKSLVYTDGLYSKALRGIIVSCVIQFAVWAVLIAVCEFFLFKRRKRDYDILNGDGVRRGRLYLTIFADMCIKYLLPLVIVAAAWFIPLSYYGWLYIVPAVCYLAVMAAICAVLSYIYLKRVK